MKPYIMPFGSIVFIFSLFTSCRPAKNYFFDADNTKRYYINNLCTLYPLKTYKNYRPARCLNLKFHFNSQEYKSLRQLHHKVLKKYMLRNKETVTSKEIKQAIKNNVIYIFPAKNNLNNEELLINDRGYGLYLVSGSGKIPGFYFLRTEKGIFFYDCPEKNIFFHKLDESNMLSRRKKNEIKSFITRKCEKYNSIDGLLFFSGVKFN